MKSIFSKSSAYFARIMGNAYTFIGALIVVGIWAGSGPLFGFSNTWQLVINTSTTIITFLMVFLIQNTQNRDTKAMQLKLDELIRATHARTMFIDLEDLSDEELEQLDKEFQVLHEKQMASAALHRLHKSIKVEHHLRKSGIKHSKEKLNEVIKKLTDY